MNLLAIVSIANIPQTQSQAEQQQQNNKFNILYTNNPVDDLNSDNFFQKTIDLNFLYNYNTKGRISQQQTHKPPILTPMDLYSTVFKLTDFQIGNFLGRGSFGTVHEAVVYKRKIALKIINFDDLKHKNETINSYNSEISNVKNLRHRNLIRYYGTFSSLSVDESNETIERHYIVYELGGKYNLNTILLNINEFKITNETRKLFSLQLCGALEYIHEHNIVHMDVKPQNIIINERLTVLKLTDFGCSVRLDNTQSGTTATRGSNERWTKGTWYYRAPELFHQHECSQITTSCDIYSLGICMWQLLTRDYPYTNNNENPHVIIYQIVLKNLRPQYPSLSKSANPNDIIFERKYKEIIENCWSSRPTNRQTAKQIRNLLMSNS